MRAQLNWKGQMTFEAHNRNHQLLLDAPAEHGGLDQGPSPKEYLLNAMGGCTAMDIVSLLQKMRQPIQDFKISIEAIKNTEHPIHFKSALIIFELTGELQKEKVIKAVDLSLSRYCGVNFMVSKTCEIKYQIQLNQILIHENFAKFEDPKN